MYRTHHTFDQYCISYRTDPALKNEIEIVWLKPLDDLDYVRTWDTWESRPAARPRLYGMRVVGYSVAGCSEKVPSRSIGAKRKYRRRIFWLKESDRDLEPHGVYKLGCPFDAVDPRTLAPGIRGLKTERAWGGPIDRRLQHEGGLWLPDYPDEGPEPTLPLGRELGPDGDEAA